MCRRCTSRASSGCLLDKPAAPHGRVLFVSESEAETGATDQGTAAGDPTWFCDQCGARFYGPGVCSNSHPANELKNIAATDAASNGASDDTPAATDGAVTPDTEPEPAAPAEPVAEPVTDVPAPAEPAPVEPAAASPLEELKQLAARFGEILSGL